MANHEQIPTVVPSDCTEMNETSLGDSIQKTSE